MIYYFIILIVLVVITILLVDFFKKYIKVRTRSIEYRSLINKFNDKHQIVADYYKSMYLNGEGYSPGTFLPLTKEGINYQSNMNQFFGKYRAKFPGSSETETLSTHKRFQVYGFFIFQRDVLTNGVYIKPDYTPLEDLKTMYDSIETRFQEAFVAHNREIKLKQLGI